MRPFTFISLLSLQAIFSPLAQAVGSGPAKKVVEYPLPAAAQTHEIIAISDRLLLISQQSNGALLKVALGHHGEPTAVRQWTVTNVDSGLHGLVLQPSSGGNNATSPTVWATTQCDNQILQIDPNGDDINSEPKVLQTIPIPSPAHGPHGVLVHNNDVWAACKDSSHVVRITMNNPSDHQVWAVSGRPIFVAVHPTSGDIYSGLDTSSKIWNYKNDGGSGTEIAVPPAKGSVPVGLISGPDGNAWVVLLGNSTGGTGTFGRIKADASIDWFSMSSKVGGQAPLIHLAFGSDPSKIWLLGSSIVCADCLDAVYSVSLEASIAGGTASPRIAVQSSIVFPTQRSWNHRIILHRGSLYATELITSTLVQNQWCQCRVTNVERTLGSVRILGSGSEDVFHRVRRYFLVVLSIQAYLSP
jgi:streptogramin lyase